MQKYPFKGLRENSRRLPKRFTHLLQPKALFLNAPLGACRQRAASARLDELRTPKAEAGPVIVDRDSADRVKARALQDIPASVAVEIAFVFLRRALGVGEPDDGVALRALGNRNRQRIHFALACDEGEKKVNWS